MTAESGWVPPASGQAPRLSAFGLEVEAELPLPGATLGELAASGPVLALRSVSRAEVEGLVDAPRTLRYLQSFDGSPYAMLEGRSGDVLFHYGSRALFHLSADLLVLRCAASEPDGRDRSWQRVLLDTVLWTTSHLRGFELLHMSAVETTAGIIAFGAQSGGGKTSIAAEFLRRGGRLFSDDILALDDSDGRVIVYPGPPLMNLPGSFPVARLQGAELLAHFAGEQWVQVEGATARDGQLAAVVLLGRAPGQRLRCEPIDATALTLLPYAVGFPHLTGRARRRFELASDLAAQTTVVRLVADPSVPATELANLVSRGARDSVTVHTLSGSAAPREESYRLLAFGLGVDCPWPLPGSRPAGGLTRRSGPQTSIHLLTGQCLDAEWSRPGVRIFEPTYPDGQTRFTIDQTAGHYRLWFSGFGRYLVTSSGTEIACEATPSSHERHESSHERHERFVFAQALPLAAVLHGFQLLHASAICGNHGVAAFVGASGAGKTSLTSRLVLRGAGFVTDDVLVLEQGATAPLAHPGPPFMAVPNKDRSMLDRASRLGAAVGASDKLHASPSTPGRAMPLRALFHLARGDALELTHLAGGDARRLLASAFAPYLMSSNRLYRHLEICEQISSTVAQFILRIPQTDRFEPILDAVEVQLRELSV